MPERRTRAPCLHQTLRHRPHPGVRPRTSPLDVLTHTVALALRGRSGERLAERLFIPVSADTLLRILRRRTRLTPPDVRVVGVDDFASLKGQRYGSIICDLECRCRIRLMPDQKDGTVAD